MGLIDTFGNWRRFRTAVTELNRLNARQLHELGITRGSIRQVARRSF